MMQRTKIIAEDSREAMARIMRDCGEDDVILSTRKVAGGIEIIAGHPAKIKPMDIANTLNCTVQTVYLYIRNNPSRFTSVSRGLFKINAAEKQLFLNSDGTI